VENGGAMVVMGDRCQKDYQRSVPKQKQAAGARLSLNFLMFPGLMFRWIHPFTWGIRSPLADCLNEAAERGRILHFACALRGVRLGQWHDEPAAFRISVEHWHDVRVPPEESPGLDLVTHPGSCVVS
jgi:hypothetical protein